MSNLISRRSSLLALSAASAAMAQTSPSTSPSDLDRVQVGHASPAFDLPSAAGGNVSLRSLRGKNVVLVFYRGYW